MKTTKYLSLLLVFFLIGNLTFAQNSIVKSPEKVTKQTQTVSQSVTPPSPHLTGTASSQPVQNQTRNSQPQPNQTLAVPTTINYQAVARNSSGAILANQTVGLLLSIEDGPGGSVLYSERQTPTTNQFGLLTLKLGNGTVMSGSWGGINWSNGNQWLKVDMDPTGGSSYTPMGESEMLTVPFANVSKDNHWSTDGTSIWNNNSGSVGIGNSSPYWDLDILTTDYAVTSLKSTSSSGEATYLADKMSSSDNAGVIIRTNGINQWYAGTVGSDNYTFWNLINYTYPMMIDLATDHVGIGTTSPGYRATVSESASGATATWSENTFAGNTDGTGIYGKSVNADWWGNGVIGEGGYRGVVGIGTGGATGNTVYGVVGTATGSNGTRIGVWGGASGGTDNYGGWFAGKEHIAYDGPIYSASTDFGISLDGNPVSVSLPAISLYNSTGASANGVSLIGVTYATGMNVGDGIGGAYADINASAFNVVSDRRMKKNIIDISSTDYDKYLTQIRNIESATFTYNWENAARRPYSHIGVIAQSLPQELQAQIKESPSKAQSEDRIGVNLADLAGLTVVGIKALDSKQSQLEKEIADLKAEIEILKKK